MKYEIDMEKAIPNYVFTNFGKYEIDRDALLEACNIYSKEEYIGETFTRIEPMQIFKRII